MRSFSTACRFVPTWLACAALVCLAAVPAHAKGSAVRTLDLAQALRLLDGASPDLAAARLRVDAATSRSRDASRWRNPSASLSMENFGGSLGSGLAESSVLVEQPLEIGGDRAARTGLARSLVRLSEAEADLLRRELIRTTTDRFLDAWELQERARRLAVAERAAAVAVAAAEERLRAGAAPAFERLRAQAFRSLQAMERGRAIAALAIAQRSLALLWGADSLGYDSLAVGSMTESALPTMESLVGRLEEHPSRRRAAAMVEAETWRHRETRAARIPDLSLGAGLRHFEEADGTGLLVGVSMPLPLWGNLGGAEAAGRADQSAAEVLARSSERQLRNDAQAAHEHYAAAIAVWRALEADVQPAAEQALQQILSGYRAGRLTYLDIQDGQRSLLEADLLLIEATAEVWRTRSSFELLLGAPLDSPSPEEGRR